MRNPLQRAYLNSSEPFRQVVDNRFADVQTRFGSIDERLLLLQGEIDALTRASGDTQEFVRALAAQVGTELQRLADSLTVPEQVLRDAQQDAEARGLEGLSAPVADLVNFAGSHRGFGAQAGVWINDPVVLEHAPHSVRVAQVNSRIVEVPYCLQAVGFLPRGSRIVDVGASESTVAFSLASQGHGVTAVDPRGYPFAHGNLAVHEGTLDDFRPGAPVDAVIFLSSVEHFGLPAYALDGLVAPDADVQALARSRDLLAPGGRVVLTVPFGMAAVSDFERTYDAQSLARLLDGWHDVQVDVAVRLSDVEWSVQPDAAVADGQEAVAMVTAIAPG